MAQSRGWQRRGGVGSAGRGAVLVLAAHGAPGGDVLGGSSTSVLAPPLGPAGWAALLYPRLFVMFKRLCRTNAGKKEGVKFTDLKDVQWNCARCSCELIPSGSGEYRTSK